MSESSDSLFQRLGGASALATMIDDMYSRVTADPELAPFFVHVEMDRLRNMQYQFLASALDGPATYTGAELTSIHHGRGITGHHFAAFCGHFADAMDAHGASKRDVDDALGRLAMYKDKITGSSNVDG